MDRTGWYALARRGELEEGDTRDVRVWGRDYTLTLRDGEPVVFDAEGRRPNAKFMVGWIAVSMFGELNDPVWPHPLSPHDGWGRAALAWIEENAEDAFGELLRACQGIDLRTRDLERVRARLEPRALAVRRTLNAFLQDVIPRCDLLVPLRKELQVRDAESGPQGWYASHVVLNHSSGTTVARWAVSSWPRRMCWSPRPPGSSGTSPGVATSTSRTSDLRLSTSGGASPSRWPTAIWRPVGRCWR